MKRSGTALASNEGALAGKTICYYEVKSCSAKVAWRRVLGASWMDDGRIDLFQRTLGSKVWRFLRDSGN